MSSSKVEKSTVRKIPVHTLAQLRTTENQVK